ncbi:uncharacterized protein V3H82_005690 [Fundulus diaphanus]
MEEIESTTVERTGEDEDQKTSNILLMSSKPLHRFVQKQPRTLGIVVLIFGCAEVMMGFVLAFDSSDYPINSFKVYVPLWQGILFFICGVLSIYAELHPSKNMVTTCLAMYVVSMLGIIVSFGIRISIIMHYSFLHNWRGRNSYDVQVACVEYILFGSSLCVFAFLIFLSTIARLALKSTKTQQLIVQHIVMRPQSEATAN